jgi:hypothetical protein
MGHPAHFARSEDPSMRGAHVEPADRGREAASGRTFGVRPRSAAAPRRALGEAVVCQLVDGVVEPLQPFRVAGSGDEVAKSLPARRSSLHGPRAERCSDEDELVLVDAANAGRVRGAYGPLQLTRLIARCLRPPGRGTVP